MARQGILILGVVLLATGAFSGKEHTSNTKPQQKPVVATDKTKTMIVFFGSDPEMKKLTQQVKSDYKHSSKEERIYALFQVMSNYSQESQSEAISFLDSGPYNYRSLWSSNSIIITNADRKCIRKLAAMANVTAIQEDYHHPLTDPISKFDPESAAEGVGKFSVGITWGLHTLHVPETWQYGVPLGSYETRNLKTGEDISISSIDTGVLAEHEALSENFRSRAGWYDGFNKSTTPVDQNGHGTHIMGTMVGQGGIGVAPGAEWITCRGCNETCPDSALLACCEWILCPHEGDTPDDDIYRDCTTAPDVVSNGWGHKNGTLRTYERCANAFQAAGIVPVWRVGNGGPNCSTVDIPGNLDTVIGVGATDQNDALTNFSSRGPTSEGRIKPDVSAPGNLIKSSFNAGVDSYATGSGTSMAAAHVAGVVALMLERCRLPYDTILWILQSTAEKHHLGETTQVCGGTTSSQFPNYFYGYGRIDALEAVKKATEICYVHQHAYSSASSYYNTAGASNSNGGSPSYVYPVSPGVVPRPQGVYWIPSYGPYRYGYGPVATFTLSPSTQNYNAYYT